MNKKVTRTFRDMPAPTAERLAELDRLAAMPDDQIDTSEIPETSGADWNGAVRGQFYRPVKQQITARLDADVLAWLKSSGRGYQTRMNAILRREMIKSEASKT